ncbi:MAG: DNA repair protein RecN [Acidobacteria bacterium]|nr:DNA repair protein RecN [Acidobacteriota bacterium]
MLRFLRIRHLAVIDAAEIEFEPGLNVLTGETGAGKSMLVEAVGLLLGGRASADLIRTGETTASVEAIFEHAGEEFLIRREITTQGRSRAYVNGDLTPIGGLKALAERLIELHGQHEHHTLLDPASHLDVLDAFGGLEAEAAAVEAAFLRYRHCRDELSLMRRALADREARQELVVFQLAELDRVAPLPAEDEELGALRRVLAGAERVERLCLEGYASLYESDDAVLPRLGGVWRRVGELAALDPKFQPYLEARAGLKGQLEDLAAFLRDYAGSIQASPDRLQQVDERLAQLERLKRKHGGTLADVVAKRSSLREELSDLANGDARIGELEARREAAAADYLARARALSAARRQRAADFASRLVALVGDLAMEGTRFEIRFDEAAESEEAWTRSGIDAAEFFVSPNPGEDLRPLARIVSGGELSRLMLAIKTLTTATRCGFTAAADRQPGAEAPGLIFDEVDAGIGGRTADIVGRNLRALGSAFQVLCITHLPQIAARADAHFEIAKRVEGGRTHTTVRRLDADARMDELGRMLGGTPTPALRETIRTMLAAGAGTEARGPEPADPTGDRREGESERAKGETERGTEAAKTVATKNRKGVKRRGA